MEQPIVAFVACHHERERAIRLANWIKDLGGVKAYDVLVCLNRPGAAIYNELQPILTEAFATCSVLIPHDQVEVRWGHPAWDASSANHMMKRVSKYSDMVMHRPFLWLEMDAVPIRSTWLDELFAEYERGGKPFMGDRVDNKFHPVHMSGIAIYPTNMNYHSDKLQNAGKCAWDVYSCKQIVPKAHFTTLIQHNYQTPGQTECPVKRFAIRPTTALFHQCKDGCLIERLRGGGCSTEKPAEVVSVSTHEIPAAQPVVLTTNQKKAIALAKARAAKAAKKTLYEQQN